MKIRRFQFTVIKFLSFSLTLDNFMLFFQCNKRFCLMNKMTRMLLIKFVRWKYYQGNTCVYFIEKYSLTNVIQK